MYCLNSKSKSKIFIHSFSRKNPNESKSGHPRMRTPIMLCLKARGIHTAPPGNSYNKLSNKEYIKLSMRKI